MFERGAAEGGLSGLVRRTVEDTLNGLFKEDAHEACRAGNYERKLATTPDGVIMRMPKLMVMRIAPTIIECRRRRETAVEETMIEPCLAGVLNHRIEDVTEIL